MKRTPSVSLSSMVTKEKEKEKEKEAAPVPVHEPEKEKEKDQDEEEKEKEKEKEKEEFLEKVARVAKDPLKVNEIKKKREDGDEKKKEVKKSAKSATDAIQMAKTKAKRHKMQHMNARRYTVWHTDANRLMLRSGVFRSTDKAKKFVAKLTRIVMRNILQRTLLYTENARKKTITPDHIQHATESFGNKILSC